MHYRTPAARGVRWMKAPDAPALGPFFGKEEREPADLGGRSFGRKRSTVGTPFQNSNDSVLLAKVELRGTSNLSRLWHLSIDI